MKVKWTLMTVPLTAPIGNDQPIFALHSHREVRRQNPPNHLNLVGRSHLETIVRLRGTG